MRICFFLALITLLPMSIGPTMSGMKAAIVLLAPAIGLMVGTTALVQISIQQIAPNEHRGQLSALFAFFANMLGVGLSPLIVGLLTDYAFRSEAAINYSLMTVALIFLPLSAIILLWGRSHYLKTANESKELLTASSDLDGLEMADATA